MRKQYFSIQSPQGLLVWDVDHLINLTESLEPKQVPLNSIKELDEVYWFNDKNDMPTCRAIIAHFKLIKETDLRYPIILSAKGRVMDGMHRVAKAVLEGRETIKAVQFKKDPEPDFVNVDVEELPY
jgi:hypothetical protein